MNTQINNMARAIQLYLPRELRVSSQLTTHLTELQSRVGCIRWGFCGSDDDGTISQVSASLADKPVALTETERALARALASYVMFELYSHDWINNDGGSGSGILNLTTGAWSIEGMTVTRVKTPAPSVGRAFTH